MAFLGFMNQIDPEKRQEILNLVNKGKIYMDDHAFEDCMKQGYNWTEAQLIDYIKTSKMFEGREMYPEDEHKRRWGNIYSIAKLSILTRKLILMALLVKKNVIIVHCSPCNSGSREGNIYYSSQ